MSSGSPLGLSKMNVNVSQHTHHCGLRVLLSGANAGSAISVVRPPDQLTIWKPAAVGIWFIQERDGKMGIEYTAPARKEGSGPDKRSTSREEKAIHQRFETLPMAISLWIGMDGKGIAASFLIRMADHRERALGLIGEPINKTWVVARYECTLHFRMI